MYKKITHNLVEVKLALSKGEGTRMILEAEAAKRKVLEDRIAELEGELEALQKLYAAPCRRAETLRLEQETRRERPWRTGPRAAACAEVPARKLV